MPVTTLACVIWAVKVVISEENRPALERLLEMPGSSAQLLLALSIGTTFIHGILFWIAARPIRKMSLMNMEAINAVAASAQPLPFGLGKVFRFAAHRVIDGLKTSEIFAWFAARAVLVSLVPFSVWCGSWVSGQVSVSWVVWTLAILFITNSLCYLCATWPEKILLALNRTGWLLDCVQGLSQVLRQLWVLVTHSGLSLLDLGIHALRFVVICNVLQCDIGLGEALLMASWYFFSGLFLWAGLREGSTGGLAALLGLPGEQFFIVASTVTLVELTANLLLALLGGGWLGARLWNNNKNNGGNEGGNA